jgi:hypothetical protein
LNLIFTCNSTFIYTTANKNSLSEAVFR